MSDVFREVDEALQQEKLLKIWNEYKTTIILSIAVLIVSSAITSFYYSWKNNKNAAETAKLTSALQADNPNEAILSVISDTKKKHQAIALLTAANLKLNDGKKEEATTLYKQLVDNKKAPRNLRDLARIFYVQNNTSNADKQNDHLKMLKPLLANDKSPWVWHARLEAASIYAHQSNDYTKALSILKPFETEEYLPYSLKQRAKHLIQVYAIKSNDHQNSANN